MVAGGHPFVEVVGQDELGIVERDVAAFGPTHNTDAPVVVAGVAIAEVIGLCTGDVRADVETLVAYQHPTEETARDEMLGSCEAAVTLEVPLIIDDVRFAIDYSRKALRIVTLHLLGDLLQRGCGVKFVSCV